MKKRERRRIGSGAATWLMVFISAILLMPFSASGKYRSEFFRTVDIVVMPAFTLEGIPVDGAVIDDEGPGSGSGGSAATPSEATYSEIVYSTVSEIAAPGQPGQTVAFYGADPAQTSLSTPSDIISPNN